VPFPQSSLNSLVHAVATAVLSCEPAQLVQRRGDELARDVLVLDQLAKELRAAVVLGKARQSFERLAAQGGRAEEEVLHSPLQSIRRV
jgi:hypothetical protein